MKTKTKKIVAMLMLVLVLCTSLPMNTFAAFITDINSNAQFGIIAGTKETYGHELHYAIYDGVQYLVFCANYSATSPDGSNYSYNGDFIVHYKNSAPQYEKIAEMIYFGYTMKHGVGIPTTEEAMRDACCTQQWVWEYIHNNIDGNLKVPARESWNGNYMSVGHLADWTAITEFYYNQYHGNVSFNGTNQKVILGETTNISDESGRLQSYKTFSETIDGVTFSHEQGSNELNVTVAEDSNANNVTFKSRDYGLCQLMPDGSEYSSSTMGNYIYIQFTSGEVQNLIFSNYVDPSSFAISVEVESGNVLLVKTNTVGDVLGGCTFDLYRDSACTQKMRTGTSDENGQIRFDRLPTGTFYIKETGVPEGYLLDSTVQQVVVKGGETTEVNFKNNEPTGEITLTKTDIETGNSNRIDGTSHHGDATLKGAIYTLYANEDIYNKTGSVKYFSKDEEIGTFTFDKYGRATTNITNNSTSANLSSNDTTLKGLPMGNYYARETAVPEGYTQDTATYTYNLSYQDANTSVITTEGTVNNKVQKAKFEVIKITSNTNTTAPTVEGAEFTAILTKYVDFYGSFDEAVKHLSEFAEDEYSIFKTGSDGHGVSGLLAYGEYTVNETYTPSPEINTVETFYVNIDKNSDGVIKELVENDSPFESYLKMEKVDKDTGKKVTLSNAIFKVYKLDTDTNEWKQISCKLGKETFTSWTTDENGIAYTETKLAGGTYKIEELKVPKGFLDLDEELIFEINNRNKTLEYDEDYDAYITVTVENAQPKATLEINKSVAMREDIDTSLVDISDLSGIKFKLSAKEDIIDYADGSVIYKKGTEIGTYNLDKDGKLTVENLPMGIYELEEIETLKGLVLDTTKHEIAFKQEDTTTKFYTISKAIENKTTVVEFSKTDITGNKELEGATLTVLDENDNIIDTWVSGEKTHKIEGLEVDKTYILREEICPANYVKATDVEFKIENTNQIQKVIMIDKVVEIVKTDYITGEEIEGAELTVTDEEGNVIDSWTSTKEPHKVTGLEEGKSYTLTEVTCPYGYEQAESITFTVSEDKETQKIEMKDMPILKNVELVKINSKTKEVIRENFKFGIYEDEACMKLIKEVESDKENGTVKFEDLRYGNYFIKELEAPKGYILSEEIAKVEINDKGVFVNGNLIQEQDSVYSFNFENMPIETPNTGDDRNTKSLVVAMGTSAMALTALGVYEIIKRRKNK